MTSENIASMRLNAIEITLMQYRDKLDWFCASGCKVRSGLAKEILDFERTHSYEHCDAMVLGSLIRSLCSQGLYPTHRADTYILSWSDLKVKLRQLRVRTANLTNG